MFYVLKCFDPPGAYLGRIVYRDDDPFRFWNTGEGFEQEPQLPLEAGVILQGHDVLAELWETPLPLMTKRLHHILLDAGVDTLDTYPVILTDIQTGQVIHDYLAFNIRGIYGEQSMKSGKMLRLLGNVNAIVVHEDLRAKIIASGIATFSFLPLGT